MYYLKYANLYVVSYLQQAFFDFSKLQHEIRNTSNHKNNFLDFVQRKKRYSNQQIRVQKIEPHKYQLPKTNWIHIRRTLDNTQKILKIVYYYYYIVCGTKTRKHIKHSQIITQFDLSISIPRGVLIFFMVLSNCTCHHNAWSTHL